MANVNFKYNYPYVGYGEKAKYQTQWSQSRINLNGSYTYPMIFNTAVTKCSHIKVSVEIENTGSGSIYGISWDFMVYRQNYGWYDIKTFTLPSDGKYTVDCDISNYDITQFAFVPSSNPGSGRTWTSWYQVEELAITESLNVNTLETGAFQYGLFVNRYGITQQINQVYANINGTLTPVTGIFANVDDTLVPIQNVSSYHYTTEKESMALFSFTPETSGKYKIQVKLLSGDHEIRLYSSDFQELYDGFFYDQSFELTAGALYYITLTHYYNETAESESYLQIYKED